MNFQKRFTNCCCLLFFILTLSSITVLAQDGPDWDSRLYNGQEYIRNGTYARGFPFFLADSLLPGLLVYDGVPYTDLPMQYDLAGDKLVIADYTGRSLISLITEKVDRFSIGSHTFRYITAKQPLPKTGFYEELYAGDSVVLLARREKKLVFPSTPADTAHYVQANSYFLCSHSHYYQVGSESSLLQALPDKKAALKKYIRDNHLRFRRDLERSLIAATSYYVTPSH